MTSLASPAIHLRPYRDGDWEEWVRMTAALFPPFSLEAEEAAMRTLLRHSDAAIIVLERADARGLAGYVQAGTRSVADGCDSSPVGYIEAWYVDPDVREQGLGRRLLRAAEEWARACGYTEMASDVLIDNPVSQRAHERSGYVEVDRVVTYRKDLSPSSTSPSQSGAEP